MASTASFRPSAADLRRELRIRELDVELARRDPLYLCSYMSAVDQRTGERFSFEHLREPLPDGVIDVDEVTVRSRERTWRWQRYLAERVLSDKRLIILKGRQIGVTWVVLAIDVAEAILMPDTASLIYRQKEDEAIDNVRRWWRLYKSLPQHFKEGIRVLTPDRTEQPGRTGIALQFPDGRISEVVPMTSAGSSGHGRSVRRITLDEGAYIDELEAIMAAVEPAAGPAAIDIVSTAHGVHNPETGEGNEYSRRWAEARLGTSGYRALFFPYDIHPERDQTWYDTAAEVQSLKAHQRHAQFPRNEHEAFQLSARNFFDAEDLDHYARHVQRPLYRCDFVDPKTRKLAVGRVAELRKHSDGHWRVFAEPQDHQYAIGADCATGRGLDFSCAYVVDLTNGELAAEFHGKLDADLYAAQLHYMGRRYGTAVIACDNVGIGEAVLVSLRHAREGRPPYPKLYRHVMSSRPTLDQSKVFGYPINVKTRPLILNQLEKWVRERTLPWVTDRLLFEMKTFVERDRDPSPAAQDGSHDDAVFAAAISLEMYRLRGDHADRPKRKARKKYRSPHPWERAA